MDNKFGGVHMVKMMLLPKENLLCVAVQEGIICLSLDFIVPFVKLRMSVPAGNFSCRLEDTKMILRDGESVYSVELPKEEYQKLLVLADLLDDARFLTYLIPSQSNNQEETE